MRRSFLAQLIINLSSSFRCCECSASLSRWYYEKDGRLFCKDDYWARFGELCHGCNDPIATGLIMVIRSRGCIPYSIWRPAVFFMRLFIKYVKSGAAGYWQRQPCWCCVIVEYMIASWDPFALVCLLRRHFCGDDNTRAKLELKAGGMFFRHFVVLS